MAPAWASRRRLQIEPSPQPATSSTGHTQGWRFYWQVLQGSVVGFAEDDTLSQSAALSYYMVFALPPMLVIIFWSAGLIYEEALVREAVFDEIGTLIGKEGAAEIMSSMRKLTATPPSPWAATVGLVTLVLMASTVFVTIKGALNRIFKVSVERSVSSSLLMLIVDRLLSIAMLTVIALIMIISLVVSALITAFGNVIGQWLGESQALLLLLNSTVLNFALLTLLFALIYRYVPDSRLPWRDAWFGGASAAALFVLGRSVIAFLIGTSQMATLYDAAGGLLVFMLWVYYSSTIFYFGATLAHTRTQLLRTDAEQYPETPGQVP